MRRILVPGTAIILISIVAVFAAGMLASWLFLNPTVPPSLSDPQGASTLILTYRDFTDDRTVALDVERAPDVRLQSPLEGRVTETACMAGATLVSGRAVVSINNESMVALATTIPLWRPLARGDRGADVKALQRELKRLHYDVTVSGVVDSRTVTAGARLFGRAETPSNAILVQRILWIPNPTTPVRSCGVGRGATIAAGDTIATGVGEVTKVTVSTPPLDLVPGARTLTVGGARVAAGKNGVVNAPKALEELQPYLDDALDAGRENGAESPSVDQAGDPREVDGTLTLASSIRIAVVPPNAIYAITGTEGCISSSGHGYAIRIVGSELGRTYVQTLGDHHLDRVDLSSKARPGCE